MIKIGDYNELEVARKVDFGIYLTDGDGTDILLPQRYVPGNPDVGQKLRAFVYVDSEGRLIATTEDPYVTVGQVAFLRVVDVNSTGAFLDWGLPTKHLLCPYREQKMKMYPGRRYPVYVYLDDSSKRIVASARIERFLNNRIPDYRSGAEVKALVLQRTDIGYKVIVDNLYSGMIYNGDIYIDIAIGQTIDARVKYIRPDRKIDLTLRSHEYDRVATAERAILRYLEMNNGFSPMGDSSSPDEIRVVFGCSKKDFKKAIGQLYKQGKIALTDDGLRLTADK